MPWLFTVIAVPIIAHILQKKIHQQVHKRLGLAVLKYNADCDKEHRHPRFSLWSRIIYWVVVLAAVFSPLFMEYAIYIDKEDLYMSKRGGPFVLVNYAALELPGRQFVRVSWDTYEVDSYHVQVANGSQVKTLSYHLAWKYTQDPAQIYRFTTAGILPDNYLDISNRLRGPFVRFGVLNENAIKVKLASLDTSNQAARDAVCTALERQAQTDVSHPPGTTLSLSCTFDQFQ